MKINTKYISTDDEILSGQPCIRGIRFPIAQLIAEIVEDKQSLKAVCNNFDIDINNAEEALQDLAWFLSEASFDNDGNRIRIR